MVRYQNKNSLKISSIFDLTIALNICCTFLYTYGCVHRGRAAEQRVRNSTFFRETKTKWSGISSCKKPMLFTKIAAF